MTATILLLVCLSVPCLRLASCLPVELGEQTETDPLCSKRSFMPDFNNRYFLKDGQPYRYISGEFHYPRVLPQYWGLRLRQLRAAGLDAVQTYVFWNLHEPRPGVYDFEGGRDLVRFLKLSQEAGLLVILRVGPYVCAEWDLGGMPSWLLVGSDVTLRSADITYMGHVSSWLDTLLPLIQPLLYSQGGPVIMMQYENEYGSFGNSKSYLSTLVTYFNDAIPPEQVPLFSTDGNSFNLLKRGSLTSSLLATIDFGINANVTHSIEQLRAYSYGTPFVNSEFYTGWPDIWGGTHQTRDTDQILSKFKEILDANGSVSFYMFSGGTNFGFMNGAENGADTYGAFVTSYDYDAPISEGGDLTEKYFAIREFISHYRNVTLPDPPIANNKVAYGKVSLEYAGSILEPENLKLFESHNYTQPLPMEYVNQSYGYILYKTVFDTGECKENIPTTVNLSIHDRAHFYLNGELVTILDRKSKNVSFYKDCGVSKQTMLVFVENMGRVNYESRRVVSWHSVFDTELKGIIQFNSSELITSWEIYTFPMTELNPDLLKQFKVSSQETGEYCFYQGILPNSTLSQNDSYLYINPGPFSKGQVFINTFNLGRYWPVKGPQQSLYVPGALFNSDYLNTITLFETDNCTKSSNTFVTFLDVPDLG